MIYDVVSEPWKSYVESRRHIEKSIMAVDLVTIINDRLPTPSFLRDARAFM